jgi:hypothetical protein
MYTLLHNVQTSYCAKRASYPIHVGEHHKGKKRPKLGADNSLRPRAKIKNPTATYTLLHNVQSSNGAKRASYPTVAGELPKGIKRARRDAGNLLRPRATLLHKVQTGYGAHRTSYPIVARELPKGINRPNREADNSLRDRAGVKNATAICILSSTRSRQAMAPTELPIK